MLSKWGSSFGCRSSALQLPLQILWEAPSICGIGSKRLPLKGKGFGRFFLCQHRGAALRISATSAKVANEALASCLPTVVPCVTPGGSSLDGQGLILVFQEVPCWQAIGGSHAGQQLSRAGKLAYSLSVRGTVFCEQDSRNKKDCQAPCCIDGEWQDWQEWGASAWHPWMSCPVLGQWGSAARCSAPRGSGTRKRVRAATQDGPPAARSRYSVERVPNHVHISGLWLKTAWSELRHHRHERKPRVNGRMTP